MQEYKSGQELIAEIEKTAKLFIAKFGGVEEKEKNTGGRRPFSTADDHIPT